MSYFPCLPIEPELMNKICKELQRRIGDRPVVQPTPLHVAGNPGYTVLVAQVQPLTFSEISRTIRAARTMRLYVRARGGCTGACCDIYGTYATVMIDTSSLEAKPRIEATTVQLYDSDEYAQGIRVLASVTMEEFVDFQIISQLEVSQSVDAISKHSTVIGAICACAPGIAGPGWGWGGGTLADEVLEMNIVDANGDMRLVNEPEKLSVMLGSMGLFGVVYDITFRCSPITFTTVRYDFPQWRSILHPDTLASIVNSFEEPTFTEIIYIPFNSCGANPTDQDIAQWDALDDEVLVRVGEQISPIQSALEPRERGDRRQKINLLSNRFGPRIADFVERPEETPSLLHRIHLNLLGLLPSEHVQLTPYALNAQGSVDFPLRVLKLTLECNYEMEEFREAMKIIFRVLGELARGERRSGKNFAFNFGIRINFTGISAYSMLLGTESDFSEYEGVFLVHFTISGIMAPGPSQLWNDAVMYLQDSLMNALPRCVIQWKSEILHHGKFIDRYREILGDSLEDLRSLVREWDEDGIFMSPFLQQVIPQGRSIQQMSYFVQHTSDINLLDRAMGVPSWFELPPPSELE